MTLEQVKAANPDEGLSRPLRQGHGPWTTDMFVEAIYNGLKKSTNHEAVARWHPRRSLLMRCRRRARSAARAGRAPASRRAPTRPSISPANGSPIISEDWRWRMITPPKGDIVSIPLSLQGQQAAEAWDPAKDEAAGEQCKAYGAPGLMRGPIRMRISWQDDNTLKLETDYGIQTRLFRFGTPPRRPGRAAGRGTRRRSGSCAAAAAAHRASAR